MNRNNTVAKFEQYVEGVARANGVSDVSKKFAIAPGVERKIVDQMAEKSDFLAKINLVGVIEQESEKIGLGIGVPIAGRTDTKDEERETQDVLDNNDDNAKCVQTNFDTHVRYEKLDALAAAPDFELRLRKFIMNRVALDRIMIGWNGKQVAKKTNRLTNPLLQDVNVGWLEKVRLKKPANLMGYDSDGLETNDEFTVGEGGKYNTLDALVFDAVFSLLDPWHAGGADLVVILGRELWVHQGLSLYNDNKAASERNALQMLFANQLIGGLPPVMIPHFPERGLVVTSFDNLSLYYQMGAMRRAIIDNPKRDRIEEFLSSNDAYVVEDYGKLGGVRPGAIKFKNAQGAWV